MNVAAAFPDWNQLLADMVLGPDRSERDVKSDQVNEHERQLSTQLTVEAPICVM